MTARAPAWIAGTLWLICAVELVGIYVVATARDGWSAYSDDLVHSAIVPLFIVPATVGVLVATRRPRNPIGWLFCLFGVAVVGSHFAATLYPTETDTVPTAGRWLVWAIEILSPATLLAMLTYLLLLFPTGQLASPRWRPVAWLAGVLIAGLSFYAAFGVEQMWPDPIVRNPTWIEPVGALFEATAPLALVLLPLVVLASLLSLVQRFRRSRGVERRQFAWFAFGVGLDAALILVTGIPIAVPIVIGIAILRHNLFDIDRIIHRTLVYGLLSACLGATYLACILLLGGLIRSLSGQSSDIVTAASTLAVAGLFQPFRSRIQSLVDQRFYRRKYDAGRALDAFSSRLREQIDLGSLSAELQEVVDATMQPAHVSLWLRDSAYTRTTVNDGSIAR